MSAPIEAQSLSSLNHLLSNPPQYPRNPTHKSQRPLILYIVRVPGSKDVFLTPLKPPTKASISLEAIQSSLYFLHVNTPEDEEVRQSLDEEKYASKSENVLPPVMRKPLPNIPQAAWNLDEPYAQSQNPTYRAQTIRNGLARASSDHNGRPQSIKRKPLQTRHIPLPIDTSVQGSPLEQTYDLWKDGLETKPPGFNQKPAYKQDTTSNVQNAMLEMISKEAPPRASLIMNRPYRWSQPPPRSMPDIRCNQSPTRSARAASPPKASNTQATITLIRRDPVSGAQWNIGTIDQLESTTFESSLKPISIELETPGYGRFVRQLDYPRPGSSNSTASSIKQAMASGEFQDLQLDRNTNTSTFSRTIEFRRQPTSNHSQKRSDSLEFTPNSPIQNKPPRNVFSFTSPWQGLCTFSNGIDGKSIKCRHVLPATNLQEESIAANIAELRFNLPWSVLGQRDTNKKSVHTETESQNNTPPISTLLKEPKTSKEAWKKGVQHLRNISKDINKRERSGIESAYAANAGHMTTNSNYSDPRSSLSEEIDRDPHRLSLKLGREKAGGGFKGNSAKLGKLIIEDEGLKMGDLVVAACMSVWWQHYAGGIGR